MHVEAKENIVVLSSILLKLAHRLQNIDSTESCITIIKVIFFLLVAYIALSSCLHPNIGDIKVSRGSILEEVLHVYKESEDVVEDHLQVCFVGEDGIDTGGLDLLKNMFSMFWEKAFKTYFTGENVFVPFLPVGRLHEANRIYPLLGRILYHSTAPLQTISVRFCRSTLLTLLHSPLEANEECLVNDFMNFITQGERQFLERAVRDYQSLTNSDKEEVKYIFWRFGMGAVMWENKISHMVVNLARQELCIKPSCLCTLMKSGIPKKHMQAF